MGKNERNNTEKRGGQACLRKLRTLSLVLHAHLLLCVPSRYTPMTQSFSGPLSWEPSTLHRCCTCAKGKQGASAFRVQMDAA